MKIWTLFSQKGQYLHLHSPPLDVVISEPEFIMIGPFQYGKEIFSCDEYLSLYLGVSVLLKDYYCSLIPQLTTVPVKQWKKTGCWTSGLPLQLTDVFQSIPLVCGSGQLPGVQTGISIRLLLSQWGILRFASAASKEIKFSLWDHINCSSSNGSFLLLRKCAGSGSLCQGYGRKLCRR